MLLQRSSVLSECSPRPHAQGLVCPSLSPGLSLCPGKGHAAGEKPCTPPSGWLTRVMQMMAKARHLIHQLRSFHSLALLVPCIPKTCGAEQAIGSPFGSSPGTGQALMGDAPALPLLSQLFEDPQKRQQKSSRFSVPENGAQGLHRDILNHQLKYSQIATEHRRRKTHPQFALGSQSCYFGNRNKWAKINYNRSEHLLC